MERNDANSGLSAKAWHVGSWNEGATLPINLAIGLDYDSDTDGYEYWTWRVSYQGELIAEGREEKRKVALQKAAEAATNHPHERHWSEGA